MTLKIVTLEEMLAKTEKQPETALEKEYCRIETLLDEKRIEGVQDIWVSPRRVRLEIVARGDWKHTHARLDNWIKTLGYVLVKEVEHGHSDSDWYTSTHYFHKE